MFTASAFAQGYYMEMKMSTNEGEMGTMKIYSQDGNSRSEMKMTANVPAGFGAMAMLSLKSEPNKIYMLNEKDKTIVLHADNDFQLDQMQGILLPEMTGKGIDVRCLEHGSIQKVSGNKVKQELKVRVGIEQTHSKKIVGLLKDSKLKVQASIQGEAVRVSGAKRDMLQEAIALVKEGIKDLPLQYGNFRD